MPDNIRVRVAAAAAASLLTKGEHPTYKALASTACDVADAVADELERRDALRATPRPMLNDSQRDAVESALHYYDTMAAHWSQRCAGIAASLRTLFNESQT